MNNLTKTIIEIITGIDRIALSIPLGYLDSLIEYMNNKCFYMEKCYVKKIETLKYMFKNRKINISYIKFDVKRDTRFERFYINVSDADYDTQIFLKDMLLTVIKGNKEGRYGVTINQIEISYDFYTYREEDLVILKKFIDHHFVVKYSRSGSNFIYTDDTVDSIFNTTNYVAKDGRIHDTTATKITRDYIKRQSRIVSEGDRTFFRYEMQFNRPHLLKKEISLKSIPINPLSFCVFDYLNILDNFSNQGIRNLTRAILDEQGFSKSSPDYDILYRKMANKVKRRILGVNEKVLNTVNKQIEGFKKIKEQYNLSVNVKYETNFQPLENERQLFSSLSCTGCEEDSCTKRMMLCQNVGSFF